MARSWRWLVFLQTFLCIVGVSSVGFAQQTGKTSAAILGLDSDDAERQADALSSALRTRARAQAGWVISDNTDSIALVTAALRCPAHPDATCEKHIGEQLKTDKFMWGTVKRVGPGQLAAEVHYWQRGKADSSVREIFPDSVKDATDPAVKAAASHIFEKLTGATPLGGTVTVKAGEGSGAVFVDDEAKGTLTNGSAKIDVAPGQHTIEVRAEGFMPSKQTVNVTASADTPVTLTLVPAAATANPPPPVEPPPVAPSKGGSGRKILGFALIGLGVVSEAIAGYEGLHFLSNAGTWNDFKLQGCAGNKNIGEHGIVATDGNGGTADLPGCGTPTGTKHEIACANPGGPGSASVDQCNAYDSAKGSIAPGFIFMGAGVALAAAGVIVLVTAPKDAEDPNVTTSSKTAQQKKIAPQVLPLVGPNSAGLSAGFSF
ncbi:MAG TPA: carboxypeptidase-like regulatory domain-containing protein [Polyangiaceae bacterium]